MKIRFSVSQLFVAMLVVSLIVMATREVLDADFWWHLRTGQWIIENHSIPHSDPFSYTLGGKAWTAHEWLAEILFYGIYRLGNLSLLALFFAGVIAASYLLVYFRSPGQPYIAGFATLLGAIASAPLWGVRPQMLTLLLFSLYIFLLERYFSTEKLRYILPLPVLMIVWVNLHAGYILGLVAMGIFIAAKWLESILPDAWSPDGGRKPARGSTLPVLGILAASILAVIINPNGVRMFTYPFETLSSKAMMALIVEWFPPDFHAREWLPLAILILLLLASGLLSRRRSSITEVALTAITAYAALRSMRNVPLFTVVAIAVLSRHLDGIFTINVNEAEPSRRMTVINLFILTAVVITGLTRMASVLHDQKMAERDYFPAAAVEWIKENKPPGNIFNTYGWGGYLIWQLYPDYKVYIDGRADMYGDAFMQDFLAIYNAQPGWKDKLQKSGVNLALVEAGSPIAVALAQDGGWKVAMRDNLSVLFSREK